MKCSAPTPSGETCNFPRLEGEDLCVMHSSSPAAAATRAERGRKGAEKTKLVKRSDDPGKDITSTPLRSAEHWLAALERRLRAVERGGEKPSVKANAAARLVSEARAVLSAERDEKALEELRAVIAEKFPDLARKLRVVK